MLLTSRLKTGDGMTVTSKGLEKAYHTDIYCRVICLLFAFFLWQPYLMISNPSPLKSSSVHTSYLPVPRLRNPDYEGLYALKQLPLPVPYLLYKISIVIHLYKLLSHTI